MGEKKGKEKVGEKRGGSKRSRASLEIPLPIPFRSATITRNYGNYGSQTYGISRRSTFRVFCLRRVRSHSVYLR